MDAELGAVKFNWLCHEASVAWLSEHALLRANLDETHGVMV